MRKHRKIPSTAPVVCTLMVTNRWIIREYTIRFATFAEAAERIGKARARFRDLRWDTTERTKAGGK